jgi:predicted permease
MTQHLLQLGHIAWFIVLPVLLLIALGYTLQKVFGMDMKTLVRLNFYVVVPAVIYVKVVTTQLTGKDVLALMGFHLLCMACWALITIAAAHLRGIPKDQRRAMIMGSIFCNSGNFGLPVQEMAFRSRGFGDQAVAMQVFVMLTQNVTTFTLGIFLAAGSFTRKQALKNIRHILRFPPLYALATALSTIAIGTYFPQPAQTMAHYLTPIWQALNYMADGFVVVALVSTGAQLALVRFGHKKYPVKLTLLLRLIIGPAVGLLLIYLLGWQGRGLYAQVLLIGCASPVSVNCVLMCIEFDNHPDYIAQAVFYSTFLSPITVTGTILLAQLLL